MIRRTAKRAVAVALAFFFVTACEEQVDPECEQLAGTMGRFVEPLGKLMRRSGKTHEEVYQLAHKRAAALKALAQAASKERPSDRDLHSAVGRYSRALRVAASAATRYEDAVFELAPGRVDAAATQFKSALQHVAIARRDMDRVCAAK